jgi:hypothetical protein
MLGAELQTATNTEKLIKDLEDSLEIPYTATLRRIARGSTSRKTYLHHTSTYMTDRKKSCRSTNGWQYLRGIQELNFCVQEHQVATQRVCLFWINDQPRM